MDPFDLPLSKDLDMELDQEGQLTFRAYDGRGILRLRPDEFFAMFQLIDENRDQLRAQIAAIEQQER